MRRIVSCMVVAVALGAMVFTGLDARADPSKDNLGQCIAGAEVLRKKVFQSCLRGHHKGKKKLTPAQCAARANNAAQARKDWCRNGSMMMQEEEKK